MNKKIGAFLVFLLCCIGPFLAPNAMAMDSESKLESESKVIYVDGTYSLPFEVLKDGSHEVSATSDYMEKPAQVKIDQGHMQVTMKLKNSAWWQYFKVYSPSKDIYVDVTTISQDENAGTRVISFAAEALDQLIPGKLHIIVTGIEGFEYDNQYDIQLSLDPSSLPRSVPTSSADGSQNEQIGTGQQVEDPLTTPDTQGQPTAPDPQVKNDETDHPSSSNSAKLPVESHQANGDQGTITPGAQQDSPAEEVSVSHPPQDSLHGSSQSVASEESSGQSSDRGEVPSETDPLEELEELEELEDKSNIVNSANSDNISGSDVSAADELTGSGGAKSQLSIVIGLVFALLLMIAVFMLIRARTRRGKG